jgi:2-amino-4-hydroxy-6-hydroxymethyldihydropteridine diphosphokinase
LSPVCVTEPIGPGTRRYANAVAAVETALQPEALLETLHHIERAFGRKRWRRWGDRVLDLDLIAYEQQVLPGRFGWRKERSGGVRSGLILPHPDMHRRAFVLRPAVTVAANWRHPVFGLTIQQMWVRHRAPRQSLR